MGGSFKFIHAADIHLDSPMRGLDAYEGAPTQKLRNATREALENLVALALEEQVAFVVIAGDLFDGKWKDYRTGLFFNAQLARLKQAGIPVFIVAGNHDAESEVARKLTLPDNAVRFAASEPQTHRLDDLRVALHGQSYPQREVPDDLTADYPRPVPDYFNIGVLHTALTGRPGHATYAPTTREELAAKGYQYWALGHVHAAEQVSENPPIWFAGTTQGRHVNDPGEKGCLLVTVDDTHAATVRHVPLDVVRWCVVDVDVTQCRDGGAAVDALRLALEERAREADGRLLAARVRFVGRSPAHAELQGNVERWRHEVKAAATSLEGADVWVEKVEFATRTPLDLEAIRQRGDSLGALMERLEAYHAGEESLEWLADSLKDLSNKLPFEVRDGDEPLDFKNPELLGRLVEEVKQLLIPMLAGTGGDA